MHFDKRTSANLDYLKAFAAFLVVLGHCLSYYTAWQPLPLFAGIAEDLIYHVHVPLFFAISGFLCHRQPLRPYYKKKVLRVLVPFWFFAFLKVFFSTVIVRHFAHADTIGGQLYDAFVIGRAYWFAYAIFLMLLIAPLFWEKDEKTAPRKAIIGMIAAAALLLIFPHGDNPDDRNFIDAWSWALFGGVFVGSWRKVNPILLIVLSPGAGILIYYVF